MDRKAMELQDLRRILRETAGVDESVDIEGNIMDSEFTELGYDSVAMIETAARINREYGLSIADELLIEAETPRRLLAVVNGA